MLGEGGSLFVPSSHLTLTGGLLHDGMIPSKWKTRVCNFFVNNWYLKSVSVPRKESILIQVAASKCVERPESLDNPYQYNRSWPVPGCQFKWQRARSRPVTSKLAGWTVDSGLVPTLQMATIPLLWPRIPLPASNTNNNTPWTRTTGARWSILAHSPLTTPGTSELVSPQIQAAPAAIAWPFALPSIAASHQSVPHS